MTLVMNTSSQFYVNLLLWIQNISLQVSGGGGALSDPRIRWRPCLKNSIFFSALVILFWPKN